ncbi:hypothetical protein BJX64DRAFT_252568 [Aspergillus heterothallicus]
MKTGLQDQESSLPKVMLENHLDTLQDAAACDNLAKAFYKRFLNESDYACLDGAIACARKAIDVSSPGDLRFHRYCFRVAKYLNSRHRRSEQASDDDLDDALEYLEMAAESTGIANEPVRERANRLGVAFNCQVRLYLAGRDDAYPHVLETFESIFDARLEFGDWDKTIMVLQELWAIQVAKFNKASEKQLELLDLPIDYVDKALEAAGKTGHNQRQLLQNKVDFLGYRASNNDARSEEDYRAAIATCRLMMDEGLDSDKDDEDTAAHTQWLLGRLYFLLSKVTGSLDDYHQATYNLQRASEATSRDHPKWKARYDLFQEALERFLTLLGRRPGLNNIIFSQEKIVADILASEKAEDQGEPQAEELYKLAQLLQLRFVERNTIEDLISVTENLEKAATKTSEADAGSLATRLGLAAECYEILYKEEDEPDHLKKGIHAAQRAIDAAKKVESLAARKRAALYSALGRCMAALSEEGDDRNLMESAVAAGEAAVEIVDAEDQSDDDQTYRQERQRYLYALEDWKASLNRRE